MLTGARASTQHLRAHTRHLVKLHFLCSFNSLLVFNFEIFSLKQTHTHTLQWFFLPAVMLLWLNSASLTTPHPEKWDGTNTKLLIVIYSPFICYIEVCILVTWQGLGGATGNNSSHHLETVSLNPHVWSGVQELGWWLRWHELRPNTPTALPYK